jgi:hypothetical protein
MPKTCSALVICYNKISSNIKLDIISLVQLKLNNFIAENVCLTNSEREVAVSLVAATMMQSRWYQNVGR